VLSVAVAAAPFGAPSIVQDGPSIDVSSVVDFNTAGTARLTDAKGRFGARFIAATCDVATLQQSQTLTEAPKMLISAQPTVYLVPAP
jgi:hypothetical protein